MMPSMKKSSNSHLSQFLQSIFINNGKFVSSNLEKSTCASSPSNTNLSETVSTSIINQYRSKSKAIKIFVASNKNEFEIESQCLLEESLPELQQYFLQFGYDFSFMDVNLNYDFDPFVDPYLFECLKKEIDDCFQTSDGCFFIALIGNKYGNTPIPLEISESDYLKIRVATSTTDFEFFQSWYILDTNYLVPRYKLRPLIEAFPNYYNKNPENFETHFSEKISFMEVHRKLIEIIQNAILNHESNPNKIENKSINQSHKEIHSDLSFYQYSGLELLTHFAFKNSLNECIAIYRNIENVDSSKKNAEKYADILGNKVDKQKEEKQIKYREAVLMRLSSENKHEFTIKWKEDIEDVVEIALKHSNSGSETEDANNSDPTFSQSGFQKYDIDFRNYIHNFNAVVVSKVRALIEKRFQEEQKITSKLTEINILQEILRHYSRFEEISAKDLIEYPEYTDRFKKLITLGSKNDHHPIFLYGSNASGKTSLLTKFGSIANNLIEPKNCFMIVRYTDLTSQCSTFEGLMYSICENLNLLLNLDCSYEIENKDISQLIQYFFKICNDFSKLQSKHLILLIDGISDVNVERIYLSKPADSNNQISWLFSQLIPPRVHLIVSIKRQAFQILRTEIFDASFRNKSYQNNPLAQTNVHAAIASTSTLSASHAQSNTAALPLFLYNFNEKLSNETENYLFELPIPFRKIEINELMFYFKNELIKFGRSITDELAMVVIQQFHGIKTTENGLDTQLQNENNQPNYLYLVNMIHEIINVSRLNNSLNFDVNTDKFPRDFETYLKFKIDSIEKRFNMKTISCICNYITAAHNGITEMELIDLLSCNNEFFSEFYESTDLPLILRFPISLWILIKHHLGNLLSVKFMDNKTTYCWSHDSIKKIMKQRYFNKVEQIRTCHKDMSNYFLESFVETKPLVDMNKNMQIRDEEGKRFICQQPLLYSEVRYNYRRLSELWYHLMNSGDIQRLKEHAFYNFEHLLAKCHGTSLQILLNDIEAVLRRILDIDILLMSSLIKKSYVTLSQNPLRLSAEILSRLRPLQDEYGEHVQSLVAQAGYWCENHESPVLIPLSTWLDSPENLLITRIDHPEGIFKIAVTSFNQHVFFSTSKHEICMYHIPSKKLVRKFTGHSDVINCLQITYNNRFLISGSSDKLMMVWNLGTGEKENTFTNHRSAILCSVITHSDEFIITGSYDRLINVIRIENGDVIHSVEKHFDAITALAISEDDSILVSASTDKTVRRWSFEDMQVLDNIATIYSSVTSMIITSDNTFVVIGCENKTVQVKSLITGTDIHDLVGHNSDITCLASSRDCERIYVACSDSKLYLYDIKSRELIAILIEQESSINDLRISSDNSFLFSSSGSSLYVLNLKKKKFISRQKCKEIEQNRLIKAIAMSKEGDMAITGDDSGLVNLWNLKTGEFIETLIEPNENQRCGVCKMALSNSNLFSVVAFSDNTVSVFDNEMGDVATEFSEHQSNVKHLFIFDDSKRILTSDGFNLCKIWVAHTGQLLESITVACNLFALSPDMKFVVSGPGENVVKIWGLNEAKVIRSIDHPNKITVIKFTHDSQFVITGGEDNSCKIWELLTGKLIQVLIEHDNAITSIDVPFNNNLIVSGAKDRLVLLWNFKDGSVIHKLSGHHDIIVKVAITFDGNIIISGSKDGIVNVWSSRYGFLLTSINLQFTLVELIVSIDATSIVARLADSTNLAIIGLTHKSIVDCNKATSQASLKSFDYIGKSQNSHLPLKPKPLVFAKKSTELLKLFTQEPHDVEKKTRRQSEITSHVQAEPISVTQHSSRGIFQKQKRKTKKSSEFSSNTSLVNKEEKLRKTRICCIL